jgi:nitroreductase
MDFFEVIEKRRSVRLFQNRPIQSDKIEQIFQTLNSAPSAGNLQGYEVVAVTDLKIRRQLAEAAYGQEFIAQAPVVLVFFANPKRSSVRYGQRGSRLYAPQDAAIAVTHAMLAATALDLATCWVGAFDDARVSKAVNAPKDLIPAAILPIGYPAEYPSPTPRRSLKDLIKKEQF